MGDVIDIKKEKEFEFVTYFEDDKYGIGVRINDPRNPLEIMSIDKKQAHIEVFGQGYLTERAKLAEMLWVAATLLDSEERYRPSGELVGTDYE